MKLVALLFIISPFAYAHSGGTIESGDFKGCHTKTEDNSFHCHENSNYPGRYWASMEAAIDETSGAEKSKIVEVPSPTPEIQNADASTPEGQSNASESPVTSEPIVTSEPLVITEPVEPPSENYVRAEWEPWTEFDCRSTRTEILIRDNVGTLGFNENRCSLKSGQWTDFYTGETLTLEQIEVDHVVSLKHAHESAGKLWSRQKKNKFFNDPDNLVVTSSKTNQQKGANDFRTWLPLKPFTCNYAKRWLQVKRKYEIPISEPEIKSFNLLKCGPALRPAPLPVAPPAPE